MEYTLAIILYMEINMFLMHISVVQKSELGMYENVFTFQ
jgi:hypothetical protein